ncbi:MAG: sulfotransferase family 2 domain-containing protein [Cyanobacteria bacterium P01_D01_bin.156]
MYSFLKSQTSLKRILWSKYTLSVAISNRLLGCPTGILLFRDPETRFLSYFHDKFRKAPRKMLAENRLHPKELQHCQRLWLNSVGVSTHDMVACCQALLETPLEAVLSWLPEHYRQDPHTRPQLDCLYAQRHWIKLSLNISRVFLIENPAEMQLFGQLLEIDTSRKVHQTQDKQREHTLGKTGRAMLRQIYPLDFELYQQIRHTSLRKRSSVLQSLLRTNRKNTVADLWDESI